MLDMPADRSRGIPLELRGYLDELVRRLRGRLGDRLVGIWLHGSASMGAFVPSRSDVDVLVVVTDPLDSKVKQGIARDLAGGALPPPGTGLELAIVSAQSLREPREAPMFDLELDMHEGHAERVVDGSGHEGDPDLLAHFAMAREHAIALEGPSAADVLPPIDRRLLLRAFVGDLDWGLEYGHIGYAVLNACRALRFAREGVLSSKPEGGAWAMEHEVGDRSTIEAALRRQAGSDEKVDPAAAAALVEDVRLELQA
jgi:predicted nucleotidyltransferase